MLHRAHFNMKGGKRAFAAGASQECENVGSRHSDDSETGFQSAPPLGCKEPKTDRGSAHSSGNGRRQIVSGLCAEMATLTGSAIPA